MHEVVPVDETVEFKESDPPPLVLETTANDPVNPEALSAFRTRLEEARAKALDGLKAATTLEECIRFTAAYRYADPSGQEWVLSAGEDYKEYADATSETWFQWATHSMSDAQIQTEAQRIRQVQEQQGEISRQSHAKITVTRYPREDIGYEYRIFATLPANSDSRYNVPFRQPQPDGQKQIYLQPATGCTSAAVHYVFAHVPLNINSVTMEIPDLELEQVMQKIGYNPQDGGIIHYSHRPDDQLYKWYYVLFGIKGGFSNEKNLMVSDFQ